MQHEENDFIAICKCANCGEIINFCTRDNPCIKCNNTLFKVEYKSKKSQ